MLFPVPWLIASLARQTYIRVFGWSKMRIFCLTWVESSLVGSVRTEISRMSPSYSDGGCSFTIKSLILIGEFNFLAFVQLWSTCGDLYFFLPSMMIKIYLLTCRKRSVVNWLHNCMQLCVGCTAFAQVCVRLCAMYEALRRLYGFCVRLCTDFAR